MTFHAGGLSEDDEYDWPDEDDDPWCTHCGGEPDMQECDDPLQCCEPRCDGTWHPCVACNGTGLAKHQVIWLLRQELAHDIGRDAVGEHPRSCILGIAEPQRDRD